MALGDRLFWDSEDIKQMKKAAKVSSRSVEDVLVQMARGQIDFDQALARLVSEARGD